MHCETLHNSCAVADVDVSSLMSNIENELRWISLFRLFFMFVWSISVWMSISSSLQCADAQSAIKTNHMHHQSSCSSLYFQVLLHVSSLNVASAWLFKIKCSHAWSELVADVFDLLLISLFSKKSDYHCILCISFHDTFNSLSLRLRDVSLLRSILSVLHDEWWLKSIFSVSYLALS